MFSVSYVQSAFYFYVLSLGLKRLLLLLLLFVKIWPAAAQGGNNGIIAGSVLDEQKKALADATISLSLRADSAFRKTVRTASDGGFMFDKLPAGLYKVTVSFAGMQTLSLDSIAVRAERSDFNLGDIILKPGAAGELEAVVIYAEKPLIQSKDGNITFNAGESALAAGSTASELLNNVPLVSKDPNGKITVRGKEPKILIDDKPVELNLQQLQDLLESLPGSSIEKIEVMTNPPPQYANEQGGIINIVTKKGKVGRSGRINISGGTRGEAAISGNFSYRRQGLSFSINAGTGITRILGEGHSERTNYYTDSANYFNTRNNYRNRANRPNFRFNLDYDLDKRNAINVVVQYNQYSYHNEGLTAYTNLNRFNMIYRLSERTITSEGDNYNPSASFSYTHRGKKAGEQLRFNGNLNLPVSKADRDFYQQYFNPDYLPNGTDSTQQQLTDNKSSGYTFRFSYDKAFNKKTSISTGAYYTGNNSHVVVDASYLKKPEQVMQASSLLSNDFRFHQDVTNFRASVKQLLAEHFSVTAGLSLEQTAIHFALYRDNRTADNRYWTWLPFFNINRGWKDRYSITLAYRRSIRRPGINELNPAIDFSDPYNVRFGNENLVASTAHNFDLVLGETTKKFYLNLGMGYNKVEAIFSQVRTLLTDGKTQITWENISGRQEYELSSWGGISVTSKWKVNLSASYTHNVYSAYDKTVNRYRNGGSFTSNLNSTYTPKDTWNITGSFTFNRFANPQGFARWNWSMNLGLQRKLLNKKLVLTANIIDPFIQETRSYTYGTNFALQSFNTAQTRNFKLSVGYIFSQKTKKPAISLPVKK